VFVDGLPAQWAEAQAKSFFTKFGEVEGVVLGAAHSLRKATLG